MVDYEDYAEFGGAIEITYKHKNSILKKIISIVKEHEGHTMRHNTAEDIFWYIVDELTVDKDVKMTEKQKKAEEKRVDKDMHKLSVLI